MSRLPLVVLFGLFGLSGGLLAFFSSGRPILAIPALVIAPILSVGVTVLSLRKQNAPLLASIDDLNRAKIGPPAPPEKPDQTRKRKLKESAMLFGSAIVVSGSILKYSTPNTFAALSVAILVIGTFVILMIEIARFIADRFRTT